MHPVTWVGCNAVSQSHYHHQQLHKRLARFLHTFLRKLQFWLELPESFLPPSLLKPSPPPPPPHTHTQKEKKKREKKERKNKQTCTHKEYKHGYLVAKSSRNSKTAHIYGTFKGLTMQLWSSEKNTFLPCQKSTTTKTHKKEDKE